ncbi:MAG: HPr family phosphocarrier protein [Deltaproteobacteria bacterium]|nr:HPr family phosphocarrier protein [Deltaproteobacteria bacterium]MBW2414037.1 HPr family phosphocarrier protein [Deltaproteobacteria bacterium]
MSRCEADVEISNELGLHLRAAAAFAKLADQFDADVTLVREEASANGKSIIAIVTLAAAKGSLVQIVADGQDADAAVRALVGLVEDRFGEES